MRISRRQSIGSLLELEEEEEEGSKGLESKTTFEIE